MNWPSHGSNPQYLYKAMGLKHPDKQIDFSANINPLGPPPSLQENWNSFFQKIMVYPDPFASNLKERIACKEGLSDDSILIGNGGAELISLIGRMMAGKKVLIVEPAFSEYEAACRANQCEIFYHQLVEPAFEFNPGDIFAKLRQADALFLCNPNNPTGVQYSASTILSIIKAGEKHNCFVILDEAFYDFLIDYESLTPYINRFSNLIIIRSMTKMFAIPGIRLGYMLAKPKVIAELSSLQPHWSINAIALLAGEICMQEESFIERTKDFIYNERKRLFHFLKDQEYEISDSSVNFYLLRDPYIENQYELFEFLILKGFVPRHTFNFPGLDGKWLRFAIKGSEENNQLMEVLAEWKRSHH
ncbi:threonine-phosphate decarboxylase CobD [Paenibacillus sp. BSR1-1]|uniref:threonine-phosphate decarboxylase CobD n=1 Tax=Paenibacillus sp. BSR1-1 TaxID=3020845 RepID=UPI0025AF26C8|nr:threonine-phosphate decarboxylase CobD [Paenibacillus sp. BSR1-1]MDN3015267.1 threonine-phosphate decarboxylase CobD [Paenibacillus sp. BSR1-1]